jgi:tetratricopeptide (TPR) repeat protein
MSRALHFSGVFVLASIGLLAADTSAVRDAVAALQRGDFAGAEQILRVELKTRPNDPGVLTLLGVALDNEKKYKDADAIHRRATLAGASSPDVWNNYANHLIGSGDEEGARKAYLRAVVLDPASPNANIQLARIALKRKNGAEAMAYLGHLPANQRDAPQSAPLQIAGLALEGKSGEAQAFIGRWLGAVKNDLPATFSIGAALADLGQLEIAEPFFAQALSLPPADFTLLLNIGVVFWRSGKLDRARELLEAARRIQPENVDVLYDLACVDQAAGHSEQAVALLAQAARLAPQRGDIQKMLAVTTGDLGAIADSAKAWDRYLQLQPDDDVARRERGFTAFQMGQFEQGVAELRAFVSRHPDDAVGHFELAAAVNKDNPAEALKEFDRALALKPDFPAAHSARGSLYYQMGKPEAALADLEAAAAQRPNDAVCLDRLGQTYLALDRAADAVRVLRKAAALAPDDSKTQLHLARALADNGDAAESKTAMDRFRQMGPVVNKSVPGGLVDYLSLTPEQRRADYRSRVEKVVREHPEDAANQVNYLRLLLEDGDIAKAAEVARAVAALKPANLSADTHLYLALAAFRATGPAEGLRLLNRIAETSRGGDYYLARAEMLGASGDSAGASAALEQALHSSPAQPSSYVDACTFLLRAHRIDDSLRVSEQAVKALPQNRAMLLLRALVLESAGRTGDALRLLEQVQGRWPEWADGWTASAIVLRAHDRNDEADAAQRTASALGANHTTDLMQVLANTRTADR